MTFGTVGCWPAGPIRPPGPWCLGPARGVPRPAPGRTSWAGLGKVRSWFLYRVQKVTFGTVGCWPAGPIRPPGPWCLGPARGVPRPAPGRTSGAGLGKVRSWFLRCSESDVWHRGLLARGPDPSSRAMVFGPCEGGPSTRAGPHFRGWFREGSKLVSTVFRRWRLAPWAAGPRARSGLQGHGVWALRGGSLDPRRAALHGLV